MAVKGQPTIEDGVPAAWGTIARMPEEVNDLIDWEALRNTTHGSAKTPSDLEDFDVDNYFVTVIVGVLPGDKSLKGVNNEKSDMHFEGNVARSEVTSYQSIKSSGSTKKDDEETPKYHYDYSISLWARNGVQTPDTLEANYHE